MANRLLDGKLLSQKIMLELEKDISIFFQKNNIRPCLAVIIVGNHSASRIYVNRKKEACSKVNIKFLEYAFPENVSEKDLSTLIVELGENPSVHGILIQLPLPSHLNSTSLLQLVNPNKDVDGFHPINMGQLAIGHPTFISCTPLGIFELLQYFSIKVEGKHVVILGRSSVVGRPMALTLLQNKKNANATVTVCHSKTENLSQIVCSADILIVAIGQPLFVNGDMLKNAKSKELVVVDVGIHKQKDSSSKRGYRLVGDVDFDSVAPLCRAITPVPGGVGPMTIAMLLKNTFQSAQSVLT